MSTPANADKKGKWVTSEATKYLDKLVTDIHNLNPGDVGSMDRVLIPIEICKAALCNELIKLVGEDAKPKHGNRDSDHIANGRIRSRNALRAELRQKIRSYFGQADTGES